jgi:hypothetical protein
MTSSAYPQPNLPFANPQWRYNATGGETSLSGYDSYGNVLNYVVNQEMLYVNGVLLVRNTDYTALTGTSITFTNALLTGDFVEILTYQNNTVSTLPVSNITGLIQNSQLQNNTIAIGTTPISLGSSVSSVAGLTISGSTNTLTNIGNSSLTNSSVTLGTTSISLGGTATTVNGITLTQSTISGSTNTFSNIPNSGLANSSITINGTPVSLGGSTTIATASAATPTVSGTVYGKVSSNGYDTFIGQNAGNNATSSFNINTGVGNYSLNALAYGTGNTAIGQSSMTQMTGNSNSDQVSNNTSVGSLSGFGLLYGSNNTIFGSQAGYNSFQGSNNILIGYGANTSSSSVSNEMTLGNSSITAFRIPGLGISWTSSNIPAKNLTINTQTGTTYTSVLSDNGALVTLNNGSAISATIPTNASVAYPIGSQINFVWITGAGQPTISAVTPGTTTILSTGGTSTAPKIRTVNGVATAIKIATDTWLVTGDIV